MNRPAVFFSFALFLTQAAGCSDTTNPARPSFASSLEAGTQSTVAISSLSLPVATITGIVENITVPIAMVGARPVDASPLRVSVVGTSLSADVNTSGQFTLERVPAGFVDLAFHGAGVDALLRVGTVQPGQRVDLMVRVNGSSAAVDSGNRIGNNDRRDDLVEINGTVARLRGTCPLVTFQVRTVTVKTNTVTNVDRGCSELRNNLTIEVTGRRQGDGSILATRIEREDDDDRR